MKKKKSQRLHFRRRALERVGFAIGERAIREMVRRIQEGEATFVRRQSNRVTLWEVEVPEEDGRKVRCVYDKRTKEIVTVLPTVEEKDD